MIHLNLAHLSGNEQRYIDEAFRTNWVAPCGPNVDAFEEDLRQYILRNSSLSTLNSSLNDYSQLSTLNSQLKIVALSSGTAAVHLGLIGIGVEAGDEVLCQNMTFCASVNPVLYLGAKPVFIDSEPETYNMDPVLLEQAIQNRINKTGRKPKAIVLVHLYGMPAKVDRIMDIAAKYDIPVMEDAAEALGSTFDGQLCGTFGRYGVWSFNGNKIITTSGGGALVCNCLRGSKVSGVSNCFRIVSGVSEVSNCFRIVSGVSEDSKLKPLKQHETTETKTKTKTETTIETPASDAQRMIWLATQAKEPLPYYQHETIGFNYRMSNISAGIGRGQMTVLNDHIRHHRHLHELYVEAFKNVAGITVHSAPDSRMNPNYWLTTILIDPKVKIVINGKASEIHSTPSFGGQPNDNVEQLRVWLAKNGIESRPLWKPLHLMPAYHNFPSYTNGISESLFKRGMCLPSGPCVSDSDVRYIVDCIKEAIEN